jgi:hypothetical protein
MEKLDHEELDLEESFPFFERAAAKGHEESIWVVSVVRDGEMKWGALKGEFAKTKDPFGWYFAGRLSSGREQFEFFRNSAERGCSWGQVGYGRCFEDGEFVEKDTKARVEWMEKAANQNNPEAMFWLGGWFGFGGGKDMEKAVSCFRDSAELGWKNSMYWLSKLLRDGEGCEKNLRQAAIWGARRDSHVFWDVLVEAKRAPQSRRTENLGCDFNQLCYSIGWGLYWFQYEVERWKALRGEEKVFGNRCLDFYCSCVELQQESIFTFLLFWNRTTGGVKEPGRIIAQMVWEGKGTNVPLRFGGKRESRGCILF